jgi:predicted nucleic acid-binding protein
MIIGIDPDIDKSGVACLHEDTKRIEMSNLSFVDALSFVRMNKPIIKCVYLEAGWLNKKSNWHKASNMSVASRIGANVGQNQAAGKLLQQCIEAEGIKVVTVRPTAKKLTAIEFEKLTKIKTRTNQEMRDAAMLIFGR